MELWTEYISHKKDGGVMNILLQFLLQLACMVIIMPLTYFGLNFIDYTIRRTYYVRTRIIRSINNYRRRQRYRLYSLAADFKGTLKYVIFGDAYLVYKPRGSRVCTQETWNRRILATQSGKTNTGYIIAA